MFLETLRFVLVFSRCHLIRPILTSFTSNAFAGLFAVRSVCEYADHEPVGLRGRRKPRSSQTRPSDGFDVHSAYARAVTFNGVVFRRWNSRILQDLRHPKGSLIARVESMPTASQIAAA